ncbi:MAG: hypothetical protein ACF8XB_23035 [Planctomycetota bacterium JB042]
MSEQPAAERTAEKVSNPVETLADVLKSLHGKVVTMVNPESLEDAPMGYQLTTGFYRAKILGVTDQLLTVATELVHKGREGTKEPVKQFIPLARIKRISFAKSDILVHI